MRYRDMRDRAERIAQMVLDRARQACAEAGLDPDLLGIHPHNAMVDFNAGRPWRGIDYSKVRLCLRLCEQQFEPHRIVDRWLARQTQQRRDTELFAPPAPRPPDPLVGSAAIVGHARRGACVGPGSKLAGLEYRDGDQRIKLT